MTGRSGTLQRLARRVLVRFSIRVRSNGRQVEFSALIGSPLSPLETAQVEGWWRLLLAGGVDLDNVGMMGERKKHGRMGHMMAPL